jgi:hypothetical protein
MWKLGMLLLLKHAFVQLTLLNAALIGRRLNRGERLWNGEYQREEEGEWRREGHDDGAKTWGIIEGLGRG